MNDRDFRRRAHEAFRALTKCGYLDAMNRHDPALADDVAALLAAGPESETLAEGEVVKYRDYTIKRRYDREVRPDWLAYTVLPGLPHGVATLREAKEWIDRRIAQ